MPVDLKEAVSALCEHIYSTCGDGEPIVVAVCKPPSYISCFFNRNYAQEIIIVHKQCSGDATLNNVTYYETSRGDRSIADLTGNPLEHPFDDVSILNDTSSFYLNETKATEMPPGLTGALTRTVLDVYIKEAPASCIPIWVVCDGKQKKDGEVMRLMCSQKREDGYIITGWATDNGSIETEPDPKTLLQNHERLLRLSQVQFRISCQHKIMKSLQSGSGCFLNMTWSQPTFSPPTSSTSLMISLTTEWKTGSGDGGLRLIWEQLLLINSYLKCLDSERNSAISQLPSSEVVLTQLERSDEPPLTRLIDILREPIHQPKNPTNTDILIDFISEVSSPTYSELDVMGKLWFLFLECTTSAELTQCLEKLRSEMKSGHIGSHLNQVTSATSLGRLVDVVSPLKQLVEIGVLKLHKEMTLILTEAQYDANILFLPKFSSLCASDWRKAVDNSLQWLTQSLCLLELICNVQKALNARTEDLHCLAMTFFRHVSNRSDEIRDVNWFVNNPVQQFTYNNLSPQIVGDAIKKSLPDEWLMCVTSKKNENYVVESRFYNGTHRPFVPEENLNISQIACNLTTNNTLVDNLGTEDNLWSAELHLIHHKFGN